METDYAQATHYNHFASGYDRFIYPLERLVLARLRRRLIAQANGRILELAVGTGVNLPLYPAGACVIGLDLSPDMLRWAIERKTERCSALLLADAARLPFAAGQFDTVVSTLLYCSLHQPAKTLAEICRVLRPGGRLLMLEHVRGSPPLLSRLTDLLNIPWFALNRSCRLNRQPEVDLRDAGFEIVAAERHAASIVQMIVARRPAPA